MGIYVLVTVVVLVIIYFFVTYNSFVKINNMVHEAFSAMDVYLKKRWDLIPNLIECVKRYSNYEKEILENVIKLRSANYDAIGEDKKIGVNQNIASELSKIMAIVESYPDLKSNQNFLDLNKNLIEIENDIANSRKYYNGVVRMLNTKILTFPSNIVANFFGFKQAEMFEAKIEEKENIRVDL